MRSNFVRAQFLLTITVLGLLTPCTQYCMTIYSENTVLYSKQRKLDFCKEHAITTKLDTTLLVKETKEGCARGIMRCLVQHYNEHGNTAHKEFLPNVIKKIIGERKYSPEFFDHDPIQIKATNKKCVNPNNPDDKYLELWLWSEKKCKNPKLKQLAQLLCVDATQVTQTLHTLAQQSGQYAWLLEKRKRK